MRLRHMRIIGVVGAAVVLLGSMSAAMAAQQPATSPTLPVIVILKSQLAAAAAGTAASNHRIAVSSADQAPLISAATALGAKNVRQYQLVNAFAATVSPQALTELAASPSVAEVIPDVTIHGDLGGADPASAGLAPGGRTSASSPRQGSGRGLSAHVIPGACSDSKNGQLAPEGLSLTGTASDNKSQPTARSLGFTGAGVKVAVISDGLDPDNVNFIRPDGLSVFSPRIGGDYRDFTGLGPGAPTSGAEAFVDSSQIAAQGRHVYNLNGYTAQSYPSACNVRIEGVAPGAALVGLDVFADVGQQISPLSTILQAINYAVETDHVNVINESIAYVNFPDINSLDVFQRFNDAAVAAGVTVVVPTDDAGPANTISSPATDPNVISVGASTQFQTYAQSNLAAARYFAKGWLSDNISAMSSSGFKEAGGTLDLVAPGDASWASCTADLAKFQRCINFFGNAADLFLVGGTSESGPFVSGAAALVIQAYRAGHHGASPSPALVKQILTSTATDLGAVGSAQGAGLLNSYRAVQLAESIGSARHTGDTLLLSSSQLNAVGSVGSRHSWPVTISNASSSTQRVSLAGRTLGVDTGVESGAVTLSNSKSPKFADVSDTENNYREFHFTVGRAMAQLTGSVAWPGNLAPCLQDFCQGSGAVSMILINPRGDLAAWTFPEGTGNFGRATVQHPMAGTWTGVISSPIGTSNPATSGTTGTVRWQVAAQKYVPFGAVSPSEITLAPGQHARVTVRASAPAAPGDASGSIVVRWPGGTGTTIAVTLRTKVDVARGGGFSGTLTGGNGWATGQGQEQYYQFSVARGTREIRADVRLRNDASDPVIEYLVSPDGDVGGYGENGIGQPGTTGAVSTLGASAYSVKPMPGLWTLIVEFAEPVAGNELFQPYRGDIVFNASSAAAPALPDSAATTLKAGTAVTVPVTITNHGASPQELFLDPRLDTTATMTLPTIPPSTSLATLPNTGQFPEWYVPNETSSLTVSQTSTIPAMFDVGAGAGDPDLASSAPGAGPLCATTASVTYAPPGGVVTPGQWVAGPAGCGPYTGPGPAGTTTTSMSIRARAFDPAVTSPLGDYNLTAINPNATPAMTMLEPGHSIVVPVTITPSGTAGSVVRGTLYVDALVGGLLPVGGASGVLPAGQISGVEMAALPYEYTIG